MLQYNKESIQKFKEKLDPEKQDFIEKLNDNVIIFDDEKLSIQELLEFHKILSRLNYEKVI